MNFGKDPQHDFPKMRGGGLRPFGTFPKIHPFWWGQASLRVMKTKIVMMSMMIMITIPIFIIITMMKKLMKKMISGRETQLRSPFYSPLNSMWQVRRNHHDYHDGDHIKSFWWSYHPRDNHLITNLAEPVGCWALERIQLYFVPWYNDHKWW